MDTKRLELARLFQRFAFGPKPGEFASALKNGVPATRQLILAGPTTNSGLALLPDLVLSDLGPRPAIGNPDLVPFTLTMRQQGIDLTLWWLDRMALTDYPLQERMTWFWHGHWATAIAKLNHALPMLNQNKTFRTYALGNFEEFSLAMLNDGALQFWLDNQDNTAAAPNENLARELMELFLLGVNRYTEDDVKALAKILTGYQVVRSNGAVSFNPKRHDTSVVTFLGRTEQFTAESAVRYLVSRSDCAQFISERLWYRFISSDVVLPVSANLPAAFTTRSVNSLVAALMQNDAMRDPKYAAVKPPVEWFIAVCRAFNLQPSKLEKSEQALGFLEKLSQLPFQPPNVGGWPAGEAWLNTASSQYRLLFASYLVKQANLSEIGKLPIQQRPAYLADLLGVAEWSTRTYIALTNVNGDVTRTVQLALCSPEFVVSA